MSWCAWLDREPSRLTEELMDTLSQAHQHAATHNNNASSASLMNTAHCGESFHHAIASALLTLGHMHAPVTQARHILYTAADFEIVDMLNAPEKVPGWGNSFYRESIDPAFSHVDNLYRCVYPKHSKRIDDIGALILNVTGKTLYPNAAAYTAVAAEVLGLPQGTEAMLFVAMRLPAWSDQFVGAAEQNRCN